MPGVQAANRSSAWQRYGRHLVLFVLTAASIYSCAQDHADGLRLSASLMSILLAHEMGHYLACRYYRVSATLPFFLPAPIVNYLVGTFGAVIRIRSPFPHRRALFDIGIAGPLAGFAVCLPVLALAMGEAQVAPAAPVAAGMSLGEPLLFRWAAALAFGPLPSGSTLLIGPYGLAAWFGLLLTGLNLIPIGQLDGGHVTYALFRGRAELLSRCVWWLCVAMIVLVGPAFILWAVLVRVLGLRHPRTLDDERPLGASRVLVALLGLAVFAVCFVPNPFPVVSWAGWLDP